MEKSARRGYCQNDETEFTGAALDKLKTASADLAYLLDRGYAQKGASVFIGNHYLLSARQRTALARSVCSRANTALRAAKEIKTPETLRGAGVNIDGFNTIITLEVALSGSPVFICGDGTVRDLAGLRGTYGLIGKTDEAVRLIIRELRELGVAKAVFWLDVPVSNSGRLKTRIAEIARETGFDAEAEVISGVDGRLSGLARVVTADGIILNRCESWFNLSRRILPKIPGGWVIDITR